jgi:hypothetical protein
MNMRNKTIPNPKPPDELFLLLICFFLYNQYTNFLLLQLFLCLKNPPNITLGGVKELVMKQLWGVDKAPDPCTTVGAFSLFGYDLHFMVIYFCVA